MVVYPTQSHISEYHLRRLSAHFTKGELNMSRKSTISKVSLAGKLSALTLAIGAMTPLLSACSHEQGNGASTPAGTQQAAKAAPSNPCAPKAGNTGPTNPCAPQAQATPSNPCAPQSAAPANKAGKKDCKQPANPCAPSTSCGGQG